MVHPSLSAHLFFSDLYFLVASADTAEAAAVVDGESTFPEIVSSSWWRILL
jgi:hypothetical protein